MSRACKCDRCGTFYEYDFQLYFHSYFISKEGHPLEDLKLDLCPMCQKSLESWFTYPERVKKKEEV